jgi:ABC-2 type transport system ATP-binding protein
VNVDPVAELKDVCKRYRDRAALENVSLTLAKGEIVGFIGPNGAGKTTLIRILTGLSFATSGSVEVLGAGLTRGSPSPDGIGLVTEQPRFVGGMSSRRNLRLLARIRDVAREDDIVAALKRAGLDPEDNRPVRAYSLGMRQRLALAQALMEQPRLLLLDEPTNGLDPIGIAELRVLLRDLADSGVTVFLASHLLTEVERVCDRVLLVDHGRIVREIDPRAVRAAGLRFEFPSADDVAGFELWARREGLTCAPGDDERSRLLVTDRPAHEVIRAVVLADVRITAVRADEASLEREFMELASPAGP